MLRDETAAAVRDHRDRATRRMRNPCSRKRAGVDVLLPVTRILRTARSAQGSGRIVVEPRRRKRAAPMPRIVRRDFPAGENDQRRGSWFVCAILLTAYAVERRQPRQAGAGGEMQARRDREASRCAPFGTGVKNSEAPYLASVFTRKLPERRAGARLPPLQRTQLSRPQGFQ